MTGPKIIKRYVNRKLYDTERSRYVTLEDIAGVIKSGEEIQVVDNISGDDVTTVTLAQIIFETEKKTSFMPIGLLRDLIRNGGESIGAFAREQADKVQAKAAEIKETADKLRKENVEKLHTLEKRVGGMMGRRAGGGDDAHLEQEMDEISKRLVALEKRLEKV